MQEVFYVICLAVGFGLGWYMKREKVPEEAVIRIKRLEEINKGYWSDVKSFVLTLDELRQELEDIYFDDESRREVKLHDKIRELEREIDRSANRWSVHR